MTPKCYPAVYKLSFNHKLNINNLILLMALPTNETEKL
jgi:hypothetical protein